MAFDAKKFSQLDWAIVGGAAVAFISGFLPWWGYTGPFARGYSTSVSGWSTGFAGWFGLLLLTAGGVYLVLRRSEVSLPSWSWGPSVIVAGLAALGLLLVVIRWITLPRVSGGIAGHIGAKYGIWVAMLAGLVELVAAIAEFRASGEALPWAQAKPST